jgi:hypothetical protein
MIRKTKPRRLGKNSGKPFKTVRLVLDSTTFKMAVTLGNGDVSLGIRRAVAIASLRRG